MLNTITFENTKWVINLQEKARKLLKTVYDFKETHKSHFINCAVVYMSIKGGLILPCYLLYNGLVNNHRKPVSCYRDVKDEGTSLCIPFNAYCYVKVVFYFKMLMTYENHE